MYKRLVAFLLTLAVVTVAFAAADGRFTLVIDAGHGGHDAGAAGRISKEKNINLNVALAFGRYVERNLPDVRVVYTRKTDVFVPLHERAKIANRNKADLFVSIHTNALPRGKVARGMETYTLGMHRAADNLDVAKRENSVILYESDYKQHYEGFDPNSAESYILFEFIQDRNMAKSVDLARMVQRRACAAAGRVNKGVKQAGFLVLRETSMPSCLIELGFITTADEERFLNSKGGIDALGRGIYQAFADYKRKYDRNITVPFRPDSGSGADGQADAGGKEAGSGDAGKKMSRRERRKAEREAREAREKAEEAEKAELEAREAALEHKAAPRETVGDVAAGLRLARAAASVAAAGKAPAPAQAPAAATGSAAQAESAAAPDVTPPAAAPASAEASAEAAVAPAGAGETVFKVQLMASSRPLPAGDKAFRGVGGVECYEEGGLYKYTCGSSADYDEVCRLRRTLLDKFPQAFIVAFSDGRRTDVSAAVAGFRQRAANSKKQ